MPIDLIVPIGSRDDMDLLMGWIDLRVQSDEYLGQLTRYPHIPKLFVRNTPMHTTTLVERINRKAPHAQPPKA